MNESSNPNHFLHVESDERKRYPMEKIKEAPILKFVGTHVEEVESEDFLKVKTIIKKMVGMRMLYSVNTKTREKTLD